MIRLKKELSAFVILSLSKGVEGGLTDRYASISRQLSGEPDNIYGSGFSNGCAFLFSSRILITEKNNTTHPFLKQLWTEYIFFKLALHSLTKRNLTRCPS